MHSKRSREGYLFIDNGEGPPVSLEQAAASGLEVAGAGVDGVSEIPTVTCGHCHAVMIVQPLRTRARAYCRKCDRYICDGCAAARTCLPIEKVFDVAFEQAHRDPALVQAAIDNLRRDVLGAP